MKCSICKEEHEEKYVFYFRMQVDGKWGSHPVCVICKCNDYRKENHEMKDALEGYGHYK